jgi:hypothetical protein
MDPSRPILFLDIDGVLNSEGWLARYQGRSLTLPSDAAELLDPAAVDQLERIRAATDCRVVLSSSWRHRLALPAIEALLRGAGFRGVVREQTPQRPSRTAEILAWLAEHQAEGVPHVALDDEVDPGAEGFARVRWVVTPFATGLTEREVTLAIEALQATRAVGHKDEAP